MTQLMLEEAASFATAPTAQSLYLKRDHGCLGVVGSSIKYLGSHLG